MPPKSEILEKVANLQSSLWVEDAPLDERSIWEGKEHGASFSLCKPGGRIYERQKDIELFYLVIKGRNKGREGLRNDFVYALGEPTLETPSKSPRAPLILVWNSTLLLPSQPTE